MITRAIIEKWLTKLADVYRQNKECLTELDAAVGDADHGINMERGFVAVLETLRQKPSDDIASLCKVVAMTLIKTVGGASGPLYGTLFMKMGPLLPGSAVDLSAFAKALAAGVDGIAKLGKSKAGEKTMLDAWVPALAALERAIADGAPERDAFAEAARAGEKGMCDTVPMLATKGRASYLGERSVGHQDPGATSTWLMLKTLAEVVE